jgi:hypothetical protein
MSPSNIKMNTLIALLAVASTSQAFTMHNVQRTSLVSSRSSARPIASVLKMAEANDEVALLRAKAQKARDEARKLAKVSNQSAILIYIRYNTK